MFSNLRKVYTICDNISLVRMLRGGRLTANPGLDLRSRVFKEEGIKLQEDVDEYFEESESNFLQAGGTYKEHVKQTEMQKDSLRRHIVHQKYFKEITPNLLTWSEKEQIRHLNSEDPDEWTPEKISESFPVTAAVAKKLLKYPWKPSTEQRIARHDASAMRNWKELKEGSLQIAPQLREHFLKFSERTIPPLNKKSIKIDITSSEDIGEFQAIVERCAKTETKNINNSDNTINYEGTKSNNSHKHASTNNADKERLTLDKLRNNIKTSMESGTEVDVPDQIIVQNTQDMQQDTVINNEITEMDIHKENNLTNLGNKDMHLTQIKTYPDRIRIPKNAWKKGATYKVEDCYYDDDGRFLYRVIGQN